MNTGTVITPDSQSSHLFIGQIKGTGLLGTRTDNPPPNFIPDFLSQLLKKNKSTKNYSSNCNGDFQCIYDTLAIGSKSIGVTTKMISRRYQEMNVALSKCHEPWGLSRAREQMKTPVH